MDIILIVIHAAIFAALGIPAWILLAFLLGWSKCEQTRNDAFNYLEKRRADIEQRIRDSDVYRR